MRLWKVTGKFLYPDMNAAKVPMNSVAYANRIVAAENRAQALDKASEYFCQPEEAIWIGIPRANPLPQVRFNND